MTERNSVSGKDLLKRLESCFDDAFSDEKELDKYLIELGYDFEMATKRGLAFVNRMIAKSKVERAKSLRKQISKIEASSNRILSETGERLRELLDMAFTGEGVSSAIQASFRDLQNVKDEDIKSMLKDTQLLNEIEFLLGGSENRINDE